MSWHPDCGGPSDSASWGKALDGEEGSSAGWTANLGRKERERLRRRERITQ